MALFEKTSTDLVRWAARDLAKETGLSIVVKKSGVWIDGRLVCEATSNDEMFGYLNGMADGILMTSSPGRFVQNMSQKKRKAR